MPTGSPVSVATSSTKSSIESTSPKTWCRLGEAQSWPHGMPRISAISRVTLAAGSMPPSPGFAPCDSLISMARTGADATTSLSRARSKLPVLVSAAEVRRADLEDELAAVAVVRRERPSPVFWRQPAASAPRLSASTALPDSEPKLMPEMLTTDAGRTAWARPRAAPSTLAIGSGTPSSACRPVIAPGPAKVRCLMTG